MKLMAALAVVGFAISLVGCASVGPVTPVTVPDVKSVTGVEPDYVTVTIKEDGSYEAVSAQRSGTSRGTGKIVIKDGHLVIESEKGHGVGTLSRNPGGDLVMDVQATLSDNSTLTAKLWPSR